MNLKMKYLTPQIIEEFSKLELKITKKYKGGYYVNYDAKQIFLLIKNEFKEEIKKNLKHKHAELIFEMTKKPINKRANTFYLALYSFKNYRNYFILKFYFKNTNIRKRTLKTSKEAIKKILVDYESESRN